MAERTPAEIQAAMDRMYRRSVIRLAAAAGLFLVALIVLLVVAYG